MKIFFKKAFFVIAIFAFFAMFPGNYPIVSASECGDNCSQTYPDDSDMRKKCETECKDLEEKAAAYEKILKLNDKQQGALSDQLEYINQQQSVTQNDLAKVRTDLNNLDRQINALERDITDKENSIKYQKKILTNLMQSYYEYDQQGLLGIVLLNEELSSSLSRSDYIEQSGTKVNDILHEIQVTQQELIKNREELKQIYEKSSQLKDELQYKNANLQASENQKQSLLEKTQGEEEKYENLLARIEKQKMELFNFSEASNLGEVFDSIKNYSKPDKKYWASTSWYFSQRDSRWGSQRIGNSKSLMKDYGCAVTAVAMVFRNAGSSIDPGKLAKEKIFYYDLINWPGSWSPSIKLASSTSHGNVSWSKIDSEIKNNHPVIIYIKKTNGRGGHYVVITGKDKKDYIVHDPYFGSNLYLGTSRSLVGKIGADSKTVIDQMIIYH